MFVPRGAKAGRAGPGPPGAGRATGPDRSAGEHEGPVTRTGRLILAARGRDPNGWNSSSRQAEWKSGDATRPYVEVARPGPCARGPVGGARGPHSPHLELVKAALLGGRRRELTPARPTAVSQPLRSGLHTEAPRREPGELSAAAATPGCGCSARETAVCVPGRRLVRRSLESQPPACVAAVHREL